MINQQENQNLLRPESSLSTRKPEVVVVTGASAGLGRAIVQAFAREGAHIGLLARGRDGLEGAQTDVEFTRRQSHRVANGC
jgi:NADP-dependent 3-hydroxy acid dehydrogenase YdfG